MKNLIFLFFLVFGFSCNSPAKSFSQGCSFDLLVPYNECETAVIQVANCSDCTSYSWSNGTTMQFNPVTQSGIYRVTVTGGGGACTSVASINVQVAPPCNPGGCSFNITETKNCGQTTLKVMNCSDCSSYNWSNGATTQSISVVQGGTYGVTVTSTSNQCTSKANKTISINSAPNAQISGNTSFCEGDFTTLTATAVGSTNCTYLWSTGMNSQSITINASGNYSVTVVDGNGCSAIATVNVTKAPKPQTPIMSVQVVGETVVLTAFPPAANYQWSNGATGPSITVKFDSQVKTFTVKIRNEGNNCWSEDSCPVPVIFIVNSNGGGCTDCGPAGCNKNGIKASNGMPYGSFIVKPYSTQLFLYAPAGLYGKIWRTPNGQISGSFGVEKEVILAKTNIGSYYYELQGKNSAGQTVLYCFAYTVVANATGGGTSSRVSEEDIYAPELGIDESEIFIPEMETEDLESDIAEHLSNANYITVTDPRYLEYLDMDKEGVKIFPNPTQGPFRIEVDMEIPQNLPNQIFFVTITDQYGRVIETKKIVKQE